MHLDPVTLMVAGSLANAASGALLVSAWLQLRHARPLLWWASANFCYAAGIGLLAVTGPAGSPVAIVAIGLMVIPASLIWGSVRLFAGRTVRIPILVAGPLLWLTAGALTSPGVEPSTASQIATLLPWLVYLPAAAWQLWRLPDRPSLARYGLIAILCGQALVHIGGMSDIFRGTFVENGIPSFAGWFSLIYFGGLVYSIGSAVLLITLVKERDERRYIAAARSDSLTGISNRGAFMESAERTLQRCRHNGTPASMIMFDLDRFKSINDSFGHAEGDHVIRQFVETVRRLLRPRDLFCRYGGEEFAVLLPDMTVDAAYVVAERIRYTFARADIRAGDRSITATVSAGVAATSSGSDSLDLLLRDADRCLYRAKRLGRDRVERCESGEDESDIARIA